MGVNRSIDTPPPCFDHPNIAKVYAAGKLGLLRYVAMELAQGNDLIAHASPERLLPLPVVLSIVRRVASALHYAHALGVVHGDVKPANIVYDPATDNVKLVDFHIGDSVAEGERGTPAYLSPERLCGFAATAASDQYALGVTLYELACGRLPFGGCSRPEMAQRIACEPHPDIRAHRPELPAGLAATLDVALAKDPGKRHSTLDVFSSSVSRLSACLALAAAASVP